MNNHYHLVLRLAPKRANQWSLEEVRDRWAKIYGTPDIVQQGLKPDASDAVRQRALELLQQRRERLADLS